MCLVLSRWMCNAFLVTAHMQLYYPPPLKADNNPYTIQGTADEESDFPYNCCGKSTPFPCRGHLDVLGTPEGQATASWAAGSQQNFSLIGPPPYGGNHWGGSCQVGFSVDEGQTFQVATSYEGSCPHREGGMQPSGQQFSFVVPQDIPTGQAIFAWAWNNREQEFFMNCAVVNITHNQAEEQPLVERDVSISFFSRPSMFFSDIGHDCETPHTTAELCYPDPGPNVIHGDGAYPLELPSGSCS